MNLYRLTETIMRVAVALFIGATVTGCFTGVESTPRITDADVRRDTHPLTLDETYLDGIEPAVLSAWRSGKEFYVTDARISRALSSDIYGIRQPAVGDTLRYRGYRAARSLAGDPVTDLLFDDRTGNRFVYRVERDPDSLMMRQVRIPFTVDLQLVSDASERLLGHKFYILTSGRRLADGTLARFRKFIPVTVSEVSAGSPDSPVRVRIADDKGDATYLLINPAARSSRAAGSFASLLSLSDPRRKWPSVSDKMWDKIVNNTVAEGMTRDECRLAVGAPAEVIRRPGYSYMHEAWRYENGTYLIFEDGILVK